MSDTFKYLNQEAKASGTDAAQSFLDGKLKQNKHYKDIGTALPVELRKEQGASSDPYAWGEGMLPGGEAYKDQEVVLNQDEIDAWNAKNPGQGKGKGDSKDGSFALTKEYGTLEELGFNNEDIQSLIQHVNSAGNDTNAYGFTSDTEHHFQELDDATSEGSIEAKMRKIGKHMGYEHAGTLNQQRVKDYINEWRAGEDGAGDAPKPKMGIKPIEHSAEIKQAKDRVRSYEEGVMSGAISESIFGGGGSGSGSGNRYKLDLNKGGAGIGTDFSAGRAEKSQQATSSFLDNKLGDLKKAKNFQPA